MVSVSHRDSSTISPLEIANRAEEELENEELVLVAFPQLFNVVLNQYVLT